eukprot:2697471-Prymnesium_polylepis.1
MSHLGARGQGCGAWNLSHRAQTTPPLMHMAWASVIIREWSPTSGHGRGRWRTRHLGHRSVARCGELERASRVRATAAVRAAVVSRLSAFWPSPLKGRVPVRVPYWRADAPWSLRVFTLGKATGEERACGSGTTYRWSKV